jgi:hypothetical protein
VNYPVRTITKGATHAGLAHILPPWRGSSSPGGRNARAPHVARTEEGSGGDQHGEGVMRLGAVVGRQPDAVDGRRGLCSSGRM